MRGRRSAEPQRTYASPKITQEDPLGGGAPRRGMFGGRARGILRREDGDPGTLANYFLFGLGGVNDMRANARADAALETQMWDRSRQVKREDEQQRTLDEAISQLPPDQQTWARMNPEAYMEALMRRRMDTNNGWNVGQGYSHAFRVNPDGTLQQGAALPLRPRAPIQGYMVPYDDGTVYTDELPEDLR